MPMPERDETDHLGKHDPKNMPSFLFSGATWVDWATAARADISKQNYSVCPRHWYVDTTLRCSSCEQSFVWSKDEQRAWFEDYYFWIDVVPVRCKSCRADMRRLKALRQEYDATVANARDHGSIEQKRRLLNVVNELQQSLDTLPERMLETKRLFERQLMYDGGDVA